jgi:predicted enzyme related to lactoylglutathione lyase
LTTGLTGTRSSGDAWWKHFDSESAITLAAMIGQVLYAVHPDRLATFYGSLFEMEQSEIDATSFSMIRPGMEFHIVKTPESIASTCNLSTPPAPRENTPLKFSVEVPNVDETATTAQTLGGMPRGEPWNWNARRLQDLIDLEGNIFQVFERSV